MQLNIKNDETRRLALELAEITGESMSSVIQSALREKLERERRLRGRTGVANRLMELGRRSAAWPDSEVADPDEILGYDENGLPT